MILVLGSPASGLRSEEATVASVGLTRPLSAPRTNRFDSTRNRNFSSSDRSFGFGFSLDRFLRLLESLLVRAQRAGIDGRCERSEPLPLPSCERSELPGVVLRLAFSTPPISELTAGPASLSCLETTPRSIPVTRLSTPFRRIRIECFRTLPLSGFRALLPSHRSSPRRLRPHWIALSATPRICRSRAWKCGHPFRQNSPSDSPLVHQSKSATDAGLGSSSTRDCTGAIMERMRLRACPRRRKAHRSRVGTLVI